MGLLQAEQGVELHPCSPSGQWGWGGDPKPAPAQPQSQAFPQRFLFLLSRDTQRFQGYSRSLIPAWGCSQAEGEQEQPRGARSSGTAALGGKFQDLGCLAWISAAPLHQPSPAGCPQELGVPQAPPDWSQHPGRGCGVSPGGSPSPQSYKSLCLSPNRLSPALLALLFCAKLWAPGAAGSQARLSQSCSRAPS